MAKKAVYGKYESIGTTYYSNLHQFFNQSVQSFTIPMPSSRTITLYKNVDISPTQGLVFSGATVVNVGGSTASVYLYYSDGSPTYSCHVNYTRNESGELAIYYKIGYACDSTIIYERGAYITDIIADLGTLPENGRHSDGYWYVYDKMASDLKGNDGGIWRDIPTGYVLVDGIFRRQSELKANVNGIFR